VDRRFDKLQSKAPRRHGGRSASPRGQSRLLRSVVSKTDSLIGGFDRPSSAHSRDSRSTTPSGRDSGIRSMTPDPVRMPIASPGTPGRTLSLGRRAGPGAPASGPSINIVASSPMTNAPIPGRLLTPWPRATNPKKDRTNGF
jgi:hypothetical protein